jgi:hypothetical protein
MIDTTGHWHKSLELPGILQANRTGTAIAIMSAGSLRRLMVLSFWAITRDAELVLHKRRAGDH